MKSQLSWMLLAATLALAGCAEGYRYPCQDPENWDKKMCQKPYCSANGTCPEDLTHYEKPQGEKASRAPNPSQNKGDCTKC